MKLVRRTKRAVSVTLCCLLLTAAPIADASSRHHRHHHHHHGKVHKIVSVAAPIGVGAAFGPAGSIGYQGFKHRRAIKHHLGRHSRS